MKKALFTSVFFMAFIAASFAQQSFKLYRLTSTEYSQTFIRAIGAEVKLSDEQNAQLQELFTKTQQHQEELFKDGKNTDDDRYNAYMIRQAGHLEGNIRIILGEEDFKKYEAAKPAIEKRMQTIKATPAPASKN